MKRALLLVLLCALGLPVAVVAGFYGFENWTGHQAWRQVELALREKGESLSIEAFLPAPVPDHENMASAPVFRELFLKPATAGVNAVRMPIGKSAHREEDPVVVKLARRFQADFSGDPVSASEVIFEGLAPMASTLDEVASAASRPSAVWPVNPDLGFDVAMPFLSPLRQTSEVLRARALASLAVGQPDSALVDFQLIVRLAQRANQPPVLIGCLAEQAIVGNALDVVQEGINQRAWSDEHLERIDAALAELRPLESLRLSIRGERALFLRSSDDLIDRAAPFFTFVDFRNKTSEWVTRTLSQIVWDLRPSGWRELDRANYARLSQEWLNLVIHNDFIRPWALAEFNDRMRSLCRSGLGSFRTPLTALAIPTFATAARRAAYMQTRLDLARIAGAIERQRLATGGIPESLDELSPRWIEQVPRDVIAGGRYFYRVDDDGGFVIYGKGWNGRDDGGRVGTINSIVGPSSADDWVWACSPPPGEPLANVVSPGRGAR